ncbi:hypothetical protein GQ55_9G205600 [Panicum hallii var. hallii]|uniref:FAR1 domain-containing protein n=1 Tax=Panicum hallii var. hallii TaxID=1504633 RepID=A0A2T7C5B7_9POAL|nr:hypothetical protein GQ55_9G205600 [Panicum hallii var. hallii]
MEANGCVSLEEIEEYNYVANQTFNTKEDFFKFYDAYALHKGFGVRKDKVSYKPSTKEVTWRRFVCSCEGYRMEKHFERTDQKRQPRALTRCECNARLDVQRSASNGIWYVTDFVDVHTEGLMILKKRRQWSFGLVGFVHTRLWT